MFTEEERYDLHQGLREVLGPARAATLMAHLPPVGWADVATKQDLESAVNNLGNVLRVEFHRELRGFLLAMIASNATLAGLAFAAARLT